MKIGQHFKAQEDKDIYITSRLNLKLPRPVDDLIPPTTLISTKPTILTDKPQWRTTLVYYLSSQILHRLRKRQAQITLEVITLPEKGSRDKIGTMVLQMDEAKLVLMRDGKRDISQIQQFVVDKGDWLSISENSRSKVKAGLFIVEMPNNTDTQDKEVGTPLQMPIRTNYLSPTSSGADMGLEIISDVSDILINTAGYHHHSGEGNLLLDDDEDTEDFEQNVQLEDEYEEEEEEQQMTDNEEQEDDKEDEEGVIAIGNGLDQYTFFFRIMEAQHISAITNQYFLQKEEDQEDIQQVYFHYEFADRQFQFLANYQPDHWKTLDQPHTLLFQGHLDDIKAWLADQGMITICLIMQDTTGKTDIIGFSEVYLKGRELGIAEQASIIYNCERIWHINPDKQFSKLQLQIGLTPGWNDENTNDDSVF